VDKRDAKIVENFANNQKNKNAVFVFIMNKNKYFSYIGNSVLTMIITRQEAKNYLFTKGLSNTEIENILSKNVQELSFSYLDNRAEQAQHDRVKSKIATYHGTFLTADRKGNVYAKKPPSNDANTFEINRLDDKYVTIKSIFGTYLSADANGKITLANFVVNNEKFIMEKHPNYSLIKSIHGKFLCVESSGNVIANRLVAKEWERLTILNP